MMNHQIRQVMILALILICLSTKNTIAQELKVGEKLPDIAIHNEYDPGAPYRFDSLNKKLVILVFWNTMCKGCIRSFPKIDSLQKKYGKYVQFFEVGREPKPVIDEFFRLHKKIRRPGVPFITGDTILEKLFPHDFVPHHVWLENGNRVAAITSGAQTTDQQIREYLQGAKPALRPPDKKKTGMLEVPLTRNLVDEVDSTHGYYSILLPQLDSVPKLGSRSIVNGSKSVNRIQFNKMGMLDLFTESFNIDYSRFTIRSNNVILETKDSLKYLPPTDMSKYDAWSRRHGYFYELVVPPSKATMFFEFMQEDLQRVSELVARIETRKLPCVCLLPGKMGLDPGTKGGKVINGVATKTDSMMRFRNVPMSWVIRRLLPFSRQTAYHLVDQTGYQGNVDMDLDRSLLEEFDFDILAGNLAGYGITLRKKECEVEVLVIKDK